MFVNTNRFNDTPQYHNSKRVILPTASNSDLELIRYAKIALESLYVPGYQYNKTGVIVMDIMPADQVQLSLLDRTDHWKEKTLMQFIDELTERYGKGRVKVAFQGTQVKKEWNLKQEYVSPCYTIRLEDILTIQI